MTQADLSRITLFMQTEFLSGSIFISTPEGRLLEELNGHFTEEPKNQDRYLEIADATIWHADGTEVKAAIVHIKKANIHAATTAFDESRGIGAKSYRKLYPFVEKEMVRVKIETPGYRITGNMHRISHQKVENVLQERNEFLPLTHAELFSLTNGKKWHLGFLALNKEQILSLYEISNTLQ